MNREWNDTQPIYRHKPDRERAYDPRWHAKSNPVHGCHVTADLPGHPLTVLKAYQQLVDEDLVEMKRVGMSVKPGA